MLLGNVGSVSSLNSLLDLGKAYIDFGNKKVPLLLNFMGCNNWL